MRVCLINPPRIQPKLWGKPSILQPLDIAYVAAVLEKEHEVHVIDAANEGWKTLQEVDGNKYRQGLKNEVIASRLKKWMPDVVGITIPFSGWWKPAYEMVTLAKSIDESTPIFLSGLHPSARPIDCLSHPNVDYVVIGEPERTIEELVNFLAEDKLGDLKKIKGIGYMKDGQPIITAPRPVIQDLDSLPFPARHLLPMDEYFAAVKENPLRGEIGKHWTTMITSRGCPYNCVFCTVHTLMSRQWRGRSPKNVIDEIQQLKDTYGIEQIDFSDENMTLNKQRMEAICDQMIEKKFNIEWFTPNGVRADTLTEPLIKKMKASGCKKIRFAPESGVQRVVDKVIKKNLDLNAVEQAIVWAKKAGIKVGLFFVLGLIGETKEDIEQTIAYAYKLRALGAESFHFSIAMPVYGTELYEQASKGGYLRSCFSDEALAASEPLIETENFSAEDLIYLCKRANEINSAITWDKVMNAARNPRKVIRFIRSLM
ncbi:MAG: B12-binding domain-containing radical SAM protein [Candidatus Bathyarchaeota archaeon]|nr:B12-binding domain-containing radical SAM protein [Candidatus Bathyarchaeota archaeon]